MRLPGRIAAAIEALSDIDTRRRPATDALRDWGVSHRFAGAGDRAAIGNLVFDALRRRASLAWRMGGETPWHLAIGAAIFEWGNDPAALDAALRADKHAPPPLDEATLARLAESDLATAPDHVRADIPKWIAPHFRAAFGESWIGEGEALAGRPPLDLRVNLLKTSRDKAAQQLQRLGAHPSPLSPVGLRISPVEGARRHPHVQAEEAFQRGRVEIQDEGSQLCALLAGAKPGEQVLDFCAGAGGKTLALAAAMENRGQIFAYDADRGRLAPIFDRLKRAGARNVQVRPPEPDALDDLKGRMDLVLIDAPCTGTGVWRRRPDAKWRLNPDALSRRLAEQDEVLDRAAQFVRPGGRLVYATCSVLREENEDRIAEFLRAQESFTPSDLASSWLSIAAAPPPKWSHDGAIRLTPATTASDGFFVAALQRRTL
jgi:16S rRNA (cytosine967-C5)-methyltransferase